MSAKRKNGIVKRKNIRIEQLEEGICLYKRHPLFSRLSCNLQLGNHETLGKGGAAAVTRNGMILLNKDLLLTPGQWAYVIAHCQLHLAFGHFDREKMPGRGADGSGESFQQKTGNFLDGRLWNLACDIYVAKFLADIKFGEPICKNPAEVFSGGMTDEVKIYEYLREHGAQAGDAAGVLTGFGTAMPGGMDMRGLEKPLVYDRQKGEENRYIREFAWALANTVSDTISRAGGHEPLGRKGATRSQQAAQWFVNHYPLLGGIAAAFQIVEDAAVCVREEIRIAAVDAAAGIIYVNPAAGLLEEELKFVLAHEFLHAGLGHQERCQGRDPYLWNIACDYVINGWLCEMRIGELPRVGGMWDETLKGLSAEEIYDKIICNIRQYAKEDTFRGYGKGDLASGSGLPGIKGIGEGLSLDEFCKRALMEGLEYCQRSGRGRIPAGLIQEIRALAMPPIPWDVELARWFDQYFPELEKRRTYGRPSRRQGATPDIPRPRYVPKEELADGRTFGVVVDTSGSMSSELIGKALGSIASYGAAREVPLVRVIFCDAAAYDAGFLAPEDIAGRVEVKGRGGTVLQPGIDLLEQAQDFPKKGPILIITDGEIESRMQIRREHAFLVPKGKRLPFQPKGKVFYFS